MPYSGHPPHHLGSGPGGRAPLGIEVRPWRETDVMLLHAAEPTFSSGSLTRRFRSGTTRFPPAYLRSLRQPGAGGRRWMATVVTAGGRLVGLAEVAWLPGVAEPPDLAVLVADAWQSRGVGDRLVREMLRQCAAAGVPVVTAEADAVNAPVIRLADRLIGRAAAGLPWHLDARVRGGTRHFLFTYRGDPAGGRSDRPASWSGR
ncbi:GNAT family N-acetyltransferase [Actinoplanes sp. NPDC049596]|uniref:GNAT family N-acetyltransferase n=1 Tax=unclassified Actinoplanes TaxID=2626549 RepID=UPI00341ADC91